MKVQGLVMLGLVAGTGLAGCREDRTAIRHEEPTAGAPAAGKVISVDTSRVNPQGKLAGIRVAIIATDGFEQAELVAPRQAFADEGAATVVISPKMGTIQGYQHDEKTDLVKVDMLLSDAKPEEFDALELPGGVGNSDKLRLDPDVASFVRSFANANKPIAAICHGLWAMVDADVLMGRKVTSWPSLKTDIANAGGHWDDRSVIEDRNFVSSRKPEDIPDFDEHAIAVFAKYKGRGAIGGGPAPTE